MEAFYNWYITVLLNAVRIKEALKPANQPPLAKLLFCNLIYFSQIAK